MNVSNECEVHCFRLQLKISQKNDWRFAQNAKKDLHYEKEHYYYSREYVPPPKWDCQVQDEREQFEEELEFVESEEAFCSE